MSPRPSAAGTESSRDSGSAGQISPDSTSPTSGFPDDEAVSPQSPGSETMRRIKRQNMTIDAYGFYHESQTPQTPGSPQSPTSPTNSTSQNRRETEWRELLENWSPALYKKKRDRATLWPCMLLRIRIPESLRAQAWCTLADCQNIKKPGEYERLLVQTPQPIFDVIERDINRCFPDHSMFCEVGGEG
ncbi:hypothetical protein BDK51DRAFT_29481 [Blyttiomyces helicus]|uniref:Rab-GAP TBC domain-containing protein n=1 Tax=Blyttiomyces helicus TaxID=388810 RepID=A0A4P9WN56_9FUNG|nr:hypothetical protein BDK51DRAFT_29481 [Blyttiomyces helicus]|eukprot:RKO94541.1 hypothetical protein BDK51DRAFT_29481 [Blyttiomyces helicus]